MRESEREHCFLCSEDIPVLSQRDLSPLQPNESELQNSSPMPYKDILNELLYL